MRKWTDRQLNVMILLAGISATSLLISNMAATKLFDLFGIAADGGLLLFPITYVVGDLTIELFDKRSARNVLLVGFTMNAVAVIVLSIASKLPPYPGWEGQDAFAQIFGFMPRIIAGSIIAWLVAGLINNDSFVKIRRKSGETKLAKRVLLSSAIARVADCILFETIAFAGVLPFNEFLRQMAAAYVAGMVLEAILYPFTRYCVKRLKSYIRTRPLHG